jgi:hypothetical protein
MLQFVLSAAVIDAVAECVMSKTPRTRWPVASSDVASSNE